MFGNAKKNFYQRNCYKIQKPFIARALLAAGKPVFKVNSYEKAATEVAAKWKAEARVRALLKKESHLQTSEVKSDILNECSERDFLA